jgi:uncharacterized protein YndB with AHSA1/START domain
MNQNLVFDFTPDKNTNSISIKREFNAELSLVWEAFTNQEILDLWGAPAPWKVVTISMDFTEGGRRFYKMVSPEGQEHFSLQDYTSISPKINLKYLSGFTDKDQQINPELYGSENNLDFSETNGITTVSIAIKYKTLAILEMMVERGFKEGTSATFINLDTLLKTTTEKK